MGKFSLTNLIMCVSKYQKLSSEDYIKLGLCLPDCQECPSQHCAGHLLKNDKMVKNNLLLNNQMSEDKLQPQHQHAPLKKIVNNLANTTVVSDSNNNNSNSNNNNNNTTCNPCKESQSSLKSSPSSCSNSHCSRPKGGVVNLAFVDSQTEQSSWYQPHLARDLAVKALADLEVGSFVVRNSRTQGGSGCLALSLRVSRNYNSAGVLHYLVLVTEKGFRIKGFTKVFSSLSGLVVHHSVMQESLPCRLLLQAHTLQGEDRTDSDFADLDTDPEYPGLLTKLREQLTSD